MAFGILGAAAVAFPATIAIGFLFWIIGNVAWLCVGKLESDKHITILFGFYLATAILGFFNSVMA